MGGTDVRKLLLLAVLLTVVAGCGGGSVPPGIPEGTATVRIHIDWPEVPSSRIILSTLHHVDITVTGLGITDPITATITRPDTEVSMRVPAGTNREFHLAGKDSEGQQIQWATKTVETLWPDTTIDLEFVLRDIWDPEDDAFENENATPISTDGEPSPLHGLEYDLDNVDWFTFEAVQGETYTIEVVDLIEYAHGTYFLGLYDEDKTELTYVELVPSDQPAALLWTAASSGPLFLRIALRASGRATFEYRLRVRAGGSGNANVSIK